MRQSLLEKMSAVVARQAAQHESLPWAPRGSHVSTTAGAACRSWPTWQRAPQTRDCDATPPTPSPAWAQRTIRSQTVLTGGTAGRGAPQASPRPARGRTRARTGTSGDASTSGRFQVGGPLWQPGGMALRGTATVTVGSCTHWLVNTSAAALGRLKERHP